jgi:hypothetical protein
MRGWTYSNVAWFKFAQPGINQIFLDLFFWKTKITVAVFRPLLKLNAITKKQKISVLEYVILTDNM